MDKLYVIKKAIKYEDLRKEFRDALPDGCCAIQLVFAARCEAKKCIEDTYGIRLNQKQLAKLISEVKAEKLLA